PYHGQYNDNAGGYSADEHECPVSCLRANVLDDVFGGYGSGAIQGRFDRAHHG
ncbi:MAG: hypothetical protein GWN81_02435, partial [Phycisphaerae bacterium]|nr:hypothetical protein [Phycisphaerae bacterium]NIU07727.1 hypothetical protein [Phycisphaerae bacterium]NIW91818.1 hypothetical protein [Phycisphaerae bacterium]